MSTTLLPFLYQTRTMLRPRQVPVAALRRSFHSARPCLAPKKRKDPGTDIPFADDNLREYIPVENVDGEETPLRGTITPTERGIFDRIFADIAARGLRPRQQHQNPPSQPPTAKAQRSINMILESAAADIDFSKRPSSIVSPAVEAGAAKDRIKALQRFPPSLRAAARKSLDLMEPMQSGARMPGAPSVYSLAEGGGNGTHAAEWMIKDKMRQAELDAQREPERRRVEDLMYAAKSDFELWQIMEREVFTLPEKLGIRSPQPDARSTGDNRTKASKISNKEQKQQQQGLKEDEEISWKRSAEAVDGTEHRLNLYVYGPLYPQFLLLGLRLLDTSFTASSPLALSVLPRIKELGLESFILGVSTPFYNELLEIFYGRHGDLSKMLDLMEEMRHAGLYFDQGTLSILNRVQEQTSMLARGAFGTLAKAVMTMPEYEKSVRDRMSYWHAHVDESVKQREIDLDHSKLATSGIAVDI
ncbi:uncharacterized protein BCR38DRAFT_443289 [Pseudomassariella vexata]|uniref:Mtf2-like C-terminal domain-containing protein n=1 Tax=Pseudomassariella vexata TaxID=1141098 RepID=A0A1Y2DP32_9PEZI|nr:uncharacterized protein BCR38DRAFT_443289 [Pseudomassariella vexata]ORY61038.1 hypothetical protein BCR38DRAFT_443289 [Pseudomassariella vexata]